MSLAANGNGNNGYAHADPPPTLSRKAAVPALVANAANESLVGFLNSEGLKLQGRPTNFTRQAAVFEVYGGPAVLRTSEVLEHFEICIQGQVSYAGRATVNKVMNVNTKLICEVTLDEARWLKTDIQTLSDCDGELAREFGEFLNEWQKYYAVSSGFKLAVADMQTFLCDLQMWLNQMELQVKLAPEFTTESKKLEILSRLAESAIPAINSLFGKFEWVAQPVNPEQSAAHASYMRQHLHPLVLCAPFANRTFTKPRGYAGDYEMVNMIIRNAFEGDSWFAKIVHFWFVSQPPAKAHRNRIKYLAEKIEDASFSAARSGRPARIFNFACGPAAELHELMTTKVFPTDIEFTLADFDADTLEYVRHFLQTNACDNSHKLKVNLKKMSVHQLIRESRRMPDAGAGKFDLVYCAGLFDYLPDSSCRDLMNIFYHMVAPGGLVIATNVEPSNPLRYGMENLLNWHLIYRNESQMRDICPEAADQSDVCVRADATGVNLFLEVRKPKNG